MPSATTPSRNSQARKSQARKVASSASGREPAPRPILQWVMAGVGALVTLAVIGIVIWEALQPASPKTLSARIVGVEDTASGHVALVKVSNDGDDTASAVDIEGVLGAETATATLDYVPGHGHAKAYLHFSADPRAAAVSVKGWSAP